MNIEKPVRSEIQQLESHLNIEFSNPYEAVEAFEKKVAKWTGAPFAVACDCNTHAIELCLRFSDYKGPWTVPKRTYISIPMTFMKLGYEFRWKEEEWIGAYELGDSNIYDSSLRFSEGCYIKESFQCLSFQFRKRLPIGRGGMILLSDPKKYELLKRAVHDGRTPGSLWKADTINMLGYHYYMTPEDAARGYLLLENLDLAAFSELGSDQYPDISQFPVFNQN